MSFRYWPVCLSLLVILLLPGCGTVRPEVGDTSAGYPTKSVADKSFSFDSFDRKRAIRAYNGERAHMLVQLLINRDGEVVKLKVIRSKLDEYQSGILKSYALSTKFDPAPATDALPYRELFYPLKNDVYKLEFQSPLPSESPRPVEGGPRGR